MKSVIVLFTLMLLLLGLPLLMGWLAGKAWDWFFKPITDFCRHLDDDS